MPCCRRWRHRSCSDWSTDSPARSDTLACCRRQGRLAPLFKTWPRCEKKCGDGVGSVRSSLRNKRAQSNCALFVTGLWQIDGVQPVRSPLCEAPFRVSVRLPILGFRRLKPALLFTSSVSSLRRCSWVTAIHPARSRCDARRAPAVTGYRPRRTAAAHRHAPARSIRAAAPARPT